MNGTQKMFRIYRKLIYKKPLNLCIFFLQRKNQQTS